MFGWISRRNKNHPSARFARARLAFERLEDRATPSVSSITANFNGTAIPTGDYIWFSNVAQVHGLSGSSPVTLEVTDQTISFTANGTPYTLDVPNSAITLNPSLNGESGVANTSFSDSSNSWTVTAPTNFSGNVLLSGIAYQFANGLPGGIQNLTWSANFTSTVSSLNVNWQYAAAVYTQFSTDLSGVQVKTVDDNHADVYQNSDHAGTPENFKSYVVGGAMGGGGSNWTGSYSATASTQPTLLSPPPPVSPPPTTGSISGTIYYNPGGEGTPEALRNGTVTLTDNTTGQVYTFALSGGDGYATGYYTFDSLTTTDSYTVSVTFPDGQADSLNVSLTNNPNSTGENITGT